MEIERDRAADACAPSRLRPRRSALTEALAPDRERRAAERRERLAREERERAAAAALELTAERRRLPQIRTTIDSPGRSALGRDVVVTVGYDTPEHDAICAKIFDRLQRPFSARRRERRTQRTAAPPTAFDRLGFAMRGTGSA